MSVGVIKVSADVSRVSAGDRKVSDGSRRFQMVQEGVSWYKGGVS